MSERFPLQKFASCVCCCPSVVCALPACTCCCCLGCAGKGTTAPSVIKENGTHSFETWTAASRCVHSSWVMIVFLAAGVLACEGDQLLSSAVPALRQASDGSPCCQAKTRFSAALAVKTTPCWVWWTSEEGWRKPHFKRANARCHDGLTSESRSSRS